MICYYCNYLLAIVLTELYVCIGVILHVRCLYPRYTLYSPVLHSVRTILQMVCTYTRSSWHFCLKNIHGTYSASTEDSCEKRRTTTMNALRLSASRLAPLSARYVNRSSNVIGGKWYYSYLSHNYSIWFCYGLFSIITMCWVWSFMGSVVLANVMISIMNMMF